MKVAISLVLTLISVPLSGQIRISEPPQQQTQNLPAQRIGIDDLISVIVYDRPELARIVRVSTNGQIELALLSEPIQAAGRMPDELAKSIASRLAEEEILVRPIVNVAVMEYRSRTVSVVGAVHKPLTFQVSGRVQLLDALALAEGLTADAGTEILVTAPSKESADGLLSKIMVKRLIDQADPSANISLQGGEQIRVPEAGKVYVVGNVHEPGSIALHDGEDLTVLKILAVSEGLLPFAAKEAYVYRRDASGERHEQRIPLDLIVRRKAPDFVFEENDLFYIPDNKGRRLALTTLDRIAAFGSAAGSAAIYAGAH